MMHNTVYRATVPDYNPAAVEMAVEALFAALPAAQKITQTTKLLLKPNLLAKHPSEHAVTTHPEVLRAVIRACKKRGALAQNITVADSSGGLYNPMMMKQIYQVCGLAAVCEAEGVTAYTACKTVTVPVPNGAVVQEFELLVPVVEADFIINLPKLKTHVMTGLTAATKNLFGTIPGLKKAEWHTRFPDKPRFGDMLIDLYEIVTPQINLLDAVVGMEGDGPAGGTPRTAGQLLASQDAPNLDLAAAHLIGLAPMRVPYLAAANARGLCADALDLATVAEVGNFTNASQCAAVGSDTPHPVGVDAHIDPQGQHETNGRPQVAPTRTSACFAPIPNWQLPESYQGETSSVDFSNHAPKILRPAAKKLLDGLAPHPVVQHGACIGCGKCAEICPQDTIQMKHKKATIKKSNCIRCFCCHEMCPAKAIAVKKFNLFGL